MKRLWGKLKDYSLTAWNACSRSAIRSSAFSVPMDRRMVFGDALVEQFLLAELGVGGGGRVDDQALNVSNVSQQAEDLQMVDELP